VTCPPFKGRKGGRTGGRKEGGKRRKEGRKEEAKERNEGREEERTENSDRGLGACFSAGDVGRSQGCATFLPFIPPLLPLPANMIKMKE
jgi:hypothetical protein